MYTNFEYIATKLMLLIFKLLGLAPFALEFPTRSKLSINESWQNYAPIRFSPSRLGCLYNMVLIAAQSRLLYSAIPLARLDKYPYRSKMTVHIGISTCVLGNSTLFAIYLILGFRQKTAARLLNRLLSVEGAIADRYSNRRCNSSGPFFFLIFLTNIVVWIGILSMRGITYNYPLISYFRVNTSSVIITWFITQYIFVIKLLYERLRAVNCALLDHSNRLLITSEVSANESPTLEIKTLRRVHTNLYEIATEVSKFYSLPILLAISHFCFIFLYSAYFVAVPCIVMVEPPTGTMVAHSVFLMIGSMQPIIILALGITSFTTEIKRTADIVNKLLISSSINEDERIELKEFALALMHRSVRFTACRLFSLDCTLMHSILSMVTTYLIIIIQHQMDTNAHSIQHQIPNGTNIESNHSGYSIQTNKTFINT